MAVRNVLKAAFGRWPEVMLTVAVIALILVAGRSAAPQLKKGDTIRIAAGEVPPHMDYSGSGREAAIIRAALREGYDARNIEFHVGPFTRHWEAFARDDRLDAVTTVPGKLEIDGFPSQVYIEYQNGIIYKRSDFPKGLGADPVAALRGKRVVAFAGAAGILSGMKDNIPGFQSYAEYDDQYVHTVMLARGFVDVVIADRLIIDTYNREVLGRRYEAWSKGLAFDPAFCPTRYHMVFRTDRMRDAFDRGLAVIEQSGELRTIDDRYRLAARLPEVGRSKVECRS